MVWSQKTFRKVVKKVNGILNRNGYWVVSWRNRMPGGYPGGVIPEGFPIEEAVVAWQEGGAEKLKQFTLATAALMDVPRVGDAVSIAAAMGHINRRAGLVR